MLSTLNSYPIKTRLSLTGTLIVARDIAHAKLKERLDKGESLPQYFKDYPVYYAGPAKTPDGYASGSFGPTTSARMDSYVAQFQQAGGSLIMLAKGNRSKEVTAACKKFGGFYLGSIGGLFIELRSNNQFFIEIDRLTNLAYWSNTIFNFRYLGPAAILAQNCIKKVELLEYPELGMEAIYKIEVVDFPCFIVVDNKGNDFFKEWQI